MRRKPLVLSLILAVFVIGAPPALPQAAGGAAPSQAGGSGTEIDRVRQTIHACIGWAGSKDFDLLHRAIANSPDFLEVHPNGVVVKGFDEFKRGEALWASPDFKAVRYEIRDLRITLSRSGDVAWFFAILDDINEWKGRPASWENTRWTGVLEKREGVWVMVQQHFSFATPSSSPAPAPAAAARRPLELVYVANAGVLVSSGETKVLIDALFDKPNPEYRAPAADVMEKIMGGAAPFDGLDAVLVTHNHPDHFDPSLAVRYLERVPGLLLLAPADAVAAMRLAAGDWPRIEPRVIPLDLKVGEKSERRLGRLPVTAFRTLHGEAESPSNLMVLFEIGGWRVFHEGDSPGRIEDFRAMGLGPGSVDLALVHFWFPLEPNCARFLQDVLKPDHIALTHLPVRLENDAPGKIEMVRASYKDIFLLLPGMPTTAFPRR